MTQVRQELGEVNFPRLFLSGLLMCYAVGAVVGGYVAIERKYIFPEYVDTFITYFKQEYTKRGEIITEATNARLLEQKKVDTPVSNFFNQFLIFGASGMFISAILAMILRNKDTFMVNNDNK